MLFLILLLFLAAIIMYYWLLTIKDRINQNIPGPIPLPLTGNGHLVLGRASKFLTVLSKLAGEYNDAVLAYLISQRYIILSSPKYIEEILASQDMITKGSSYDFMHPWLGRGLLTATGHRWKSHRKLLNPAFHYVQLQKSLPIFLKNTKILIKKLKDHANGEIVDLFPIVALTALDNISEGLLGASMNAQTESDSKIALAVDEICRVIALRTENFLLAYDFIFNLTPYKKIQEKALEILHAHSYSVIEGREKELESEIQKGEVKDTDTSTKNSSMFLDILLTAEIDGKKLSKEKIREEVDTFIFEGHDSVTSGISYTLYCLSKHRDIQEKVFEEQNLIFGSDLYRDVTNTDIPEMRYLEMVIKEALRLFPPVPLIERQVTEDTNIAGLKVKKDSQVVINIHRLHRNPKVFKDPTEFRPERFSESLKSAYQWLPFSSGPRNCIGQRYALLQIKVVISAIVRNFVVLPADVDLELCAFLILKSVTGIKVRLMPRSQKN